MAVDLATPVLVVDDYQSMIHIVQALLKQIGFTRVDGATSGASGGSVLLRMPRIAPASMPAMAR